MVQPGSATDGTLIGHRYLLRERLGAGAFGVVHRAEQRALGITLRDVAVKLFDSEKLSLPAEALLHDALALIAVLDRCQDPELRALFVHCLDAGVDTSAGARPYVVMELVHSDLEREIGGTALPVPAALDHALQIAKAMAFMHEQGHLHRDLKPANVLLTTDRRVKIGDFGLAVAATEVLRTAPLAGTIAYQPPEALALGRCTPASDVYSIGLICYEMLTGSLPYPDEALQAAESDLGALIELKARPPEPPSTGRNLQLRGYPELEDVILCALDSQASRYPDAGALHNALSAAARERRSPQTRRATPWELIEERVERARAALRRDDLNRAGALAEAARVANAELPDEQMVAGVYPLLVDVALCSGQRAEAERVAAEGVSRRRCRLTYEAAARAHAGSALGEAFATRAREVGT